MRNGSVLYSDDVHGSPKWKMLLFKKEIELNLYHYVCRHKKQHETDPNRALILFLSLLVSLNDNRNHFLFVLTSVKNSTLRLVIYIRFHTINCPLLPPGLRHRSTRYWIIHGGQRLMSFPTNSTHKYSNVNRLLYVSRDSTFGIATSYGLDERGVGVRVPVGWRIFSSPRRPDRLWGAPNLLSNG
jgi:hypothetical protein